MKSTILSVLLSSLFFVSASAQFKGIQVEKVNNGGKVKGTTYRIYATVTNETDQIYSVGGVSGAPLLIESTKPFYQSPLGGPTSTHLNRKVATDNPAARFDSFVTIGSLDNYNNSLNVFTTDFSNFEEGGSLSIEDGGWWVLPDQKQSVGGAEKRVLIMQLTTEGVVTGKVNIYGRINKGLDSTGSPVWENIAEMGVTFTTAGGK